MSIRARNPLLGSMNTETNPKKTQSATALLMTKPEAAQRYAMSLRFLSELIEAGVIPSIKFARKCVRVPIAEADAAVLAYKTGGAQ